MIYAELKTVALLKDNYAIDATGGGLWVNTSTYRATVPTGKRWFLIGGICSRDVNSSASVRIYNSTPVQVHNVDEYAAAASVFAFPSRQTGINASTPSGLPFVLDAGWYLQIAFGVAQGAAAFATCVVLEVDV